jgi:acetylornithine aminotransferase/acetylornithine/N-succinyldiaminopimelate aminotransferase
MTKTAASQLAKVAQQESRLLLPTYERQLILLERGQGVHVWDSTGKKYLDFLSGIGVNALGHNHPAIQRVIKRQAGRLIHISNLFFHPYQAELAARLTAMSGLDRAFFCNSGTEAWEGALKLARAFAQMSNRNGSRAKWRILAMDNSFHGRTFGALATTGQKKYRTPFIPLMPGVQFVEFNNLDDLQRKFDSTVCAVCIETIQGEGGVDPVNAEFLALARKLTERSGALLVLDEIQCGLGRTGRHFAYQHYGVLPDVVTVAKPLAAGLPLGAILTTERVAACMHPGLHGTTFGGGPLACAVAIEFLREEERLLKHVDAMGEYFHAALQGLDRKYSSVQDVRGAGLMQAIELDSPDLAKAVLKKMLDAGIIINRTHDTVLRFLPPYIIQKKHVDQVIKALDQALGEAVESGNTSQRADKSEKKKKKRGASSSRGEAVQREAGERAKNQREAKYAHA